jgi:hypothetical protein
MGEIIEQNARDGDDEEKSGASADSKFWPSTVNNP